MSVDLPGQLPPAFNQIRFASAKPEESRSASLGITYCLTPGIPAFRRGERVGRVTAANPADRYGGSTARKCAIVLMSSSDRPAAISVIAAPPELGRAFER